MRHEFIPKPFPFKIPMEILITELLFFAIVFTLCLIIYFRTKDIYELTKHKGIYFFRNIFLFFALAYGFRLLHLFFVLSFEPADMASIRFIWPISLVLVSYFSTVAIFSLVITAVVKNIRDNIHHIIFWLHCLAIFIALTTFVTRSHIILLYIHGALLLFTVIWLFFQPKTKSVSQNKLTYILLFLFWILNALAFTKRLLPQEYKMPLYILSAAVFFWIFMRVMKRLHHVKKKRSA